MDDTLHTTCDNLLVGQWVEYQTLWLQSVNKPPPYWTELGWLLHARFMSKYVKRTAHSMPTYSVFISTTSPLFISLSHLRSDILQINENCANINTTHKEKVLWLVTMNSWIKREVIPPSGYYLQIESTGSRISWMTEGQVGTIIDSGHVVLPCHEDHTVNFDEEFGKFQKLRVSIKSGIPRWSFGPL